MDTLTPKTEPPPSRLRSRLTLLAFLAAFVAVIGGALLFVPDYVKKERELVTAATAKVLYLAIEAAGADRTPGGIGYPAESGAKTTREYLAALQDKGYIALKDYPLLSNLVILNTSEADSRDTVLFISRAGYARYGEGHERKLSPVYFVYRLDGSCETYPIDVAPRGLPQRTPVFLEP